MKVSELIGGGYNDFWNCKKRYRVCKGSRASKKSKTTALNMIVRLIQYPKANLLVVRRNFNTLKDSCYSDLRWAIDRIGVNEFFRCTNNPLEITYLPTGQKILFRGLDDGLKITSISVPKGVLCWVWIEEAYELTKEEDFNKLDLSIRGEVPEGYFKQLTITFNPWSANSWLKARFFDRDSDNIFCKTTTYECNEWLDSSDLSVFEEMKENNPRRYWIEGLGNWGISEGLIYDKVELLEFNVDELRTKANMLSSFSLDFGFTDPNAFICCLIDKKNKNIYVFDEWYKTGVTNIQIAEQIKNMGYGGQRVICDSAEPKAIQELNDLGIKAEASRKGADSVLFGIQLLQNYTFKIHPKCKEFYREILNYAWQKDKFGKPIDKPEHEFSHGMDSIRYGVTKMLVGDTFSFD